MPSSLSVSSWMASVLCCRVLFRKATTSALSSRSCKYCCSSSLFRSSNLNKFQVKCAAALNYPNSQFLQYKEISTSSCVGPSQLELLRQRLFCQHHHLRSLSFLRSNFSSSDLIWIWNHSLSTLSFILYTLSYLSLEVSSLACLMCCLTISFNYSNHSLSLFFVIL